jgi:von Willebrand factor type A domain
MSAAVINQVDVAFVVDTTGSMGPFIQQARAQLLGVVEALSQRDGLDVRIGVVEYRDHPPQEASFVTRGYGFTPDRKQVQRVIEQLQPAGGGDAPEAVFDGVRAACDKLEWRAGSARLVLLVGDAPPHGVGASGDAFRDGCPCGLDMDATTACIEQARATLHAICMVREQTTVAAFRQLAAGSGGVVVDAADSTKVMDRVRQRLEADFADVAFDRQVLDQVVRRRAVDAQQIAGAIGSGRLAVAAALSRLGRRGLLDGMAA